MTLRLLVDEPVNGFVARAIAETHDTVFAVKIGLSGRPDDEISARAAALQRLVVTEDRNFARYAVGLAAPHPGIIVLELEDMTIDERIGRVLAVLADAPEGFGSQVTIIRSSRVRRRPI